MTNGQGSHREERPSREQGEGLPVEVHGQPAGGDEAIAAAGIGEVPRLTGKQKSVLAIVAFTFALMIFAIVSWAQIINGPDATSYRMAARLVLPGAGGTVYLDVDRGRPDRWPRGRRA